MTVFTRRGVQLTLACLALTLVAVPLDSWVAIHLHDVVRRAPWAVDVLKVVTVTGRPAWCYAVCAGVSAYLLWRRRWQLAVYLCASTVLGLAIDNLVKAAVGRDRPLLDQPVATALGKSFPSGHAVAATVTYGSLLVIFLPVMRRKRLAIASTVVLVILIGFTRVALGVHYVSDVLGGFALGTAWMVVATAARRGPAL